MSGWGARFGLCVLSCALAGAALPWVATATTPPRSATGGHPGTVSVPAYAGTTRVSARLPVGGRVAYRLPDLPKGAQRVWGDWDGDGAETSGTFVAGQWQLYDEVVRAAGAGVAVQLGQPGDRPVTGDWNGDGITDLGVVRGHEWILTLGPYGDPSAGGDDGHRSGSVGADEPQVWRDFFFGSATDTPVTGDWNGDGSDGVGVFRDGTWFLADPLRHTSRPTVVSYGTVGDLPVVGDWDGDGTDGIGVDRGARWYLSDSATAPRTVSRPRLVGESGDVPLAWRVPVSSGAATCPTRQAAVPGRRSWVVPSTVLDRNVSAAVDPTARKVRGSLEQAERFLLGTRYDSTWRATSSRAYLSLLGRPGRDELAIRVPAMAALTVAIGMTTGADDRFVSARSHTTPERYVDQLVRSIACEHESVSPGGWGLGWETAHWAMLTGAAAWLVWDRLTPQTQSDITAMLVSEADHQAQLAVPYWGRPDGSIATPGDTRAEECAWNAGLLSLASSMMPSAPHAALWRAKAAELSVAAYATESDLTSTAPVNGVPLDARLQGFNAYGDGTVENHQRIHPDYASTIQLLWQAADFDRLAGQEVPEAMFHNAGLVYSALSTVQFQPGAASPAGGAYDAPGGTVYVPGSPHVYYPQGDDWGVVRRAHFVSLDAHALVYAGYVGADGWPAADALAEHEKGQRALWRTSGADDGRTYSIDPEVADTQDTYPGREEYAAENLATAWLALYVGQLGVPALDSSTLPVPGSTQQAPRIPASTALAP